MSKFSDTIRGLNWAAPFVLAARKPTSMAACYDMSLAGSEVLRRLGFDANPLPCVVMSEAPDRSLIHCLGLNGDEVRARANADGNTDLDIEVQGEGHHVVIEVKHRGARALIDLTIGQLRRYGIPTTLTAWYFSKDWPVINMGGWRLQYEPSPRANEALARTLLYRDQMAGIVDDLEELTRAARQCREYDPFMDSLRASTDRALWDKIVRVLNSWSELGPRP